MKDLDFKILKEEDRLDDFSLENIKGGMQSQGPGCCGTNTGCNVNQIVPTQTACPWCPAE